MRRVETRIDPITGEITTIDVYESEKKSDLMRKGYYLIYPELIDKLSLLTGSEPTVLSYILNNSNKQNSIKITYKELSKKLNLSLERIKQIMKKLQRLNIVKNIGGIIYINPFMFSKAKNKTGQLQFDYMPIFKKKD